MSTVQERVCILCGEAIGLGRQFFTGTGINRDTHRHVECVAAQPWKERAEKSEAALLAIEHDVLTAHADLTWLEQNIVDRIASVLGEPGKRSTSAPSTDGGKTEP